MKWFTSLTGDEIPAVRKLVAEIFPDEFFTPGAYQRCRQEGCRRVQRKDRWARGGTLPEPEEK
jgi:hypothetical protein